MLNNFLDDKQPRYIEYLSFLYFLGSFFFLGRIYPLDRLAWLCILAAAVLVLPFLYLYYRIVMRYRVTGWQLLLGLALAVFSGSVMLFCFSQFIRTCVMPNTPDWAVPALLVILAVMLAARDIHVLERFSRLSGPVVLILVLLSIWSSFSKVKFPYTHGFFNIQTFFTLESGSPWYHVLFFFLIFLGEGYILITMLGIRKKTPAIFRETVKGLMLSAVCLSAIYLVTVMALGPSIFELLTYPLYYPPGLTQTAEYLERIEVILLAVFTFAEFVKLSLYLMLAKEVFRPGLMLFKSREKGMERAST